MILEKRIPFKYWFNLIKWEFITISLLSTGIYFLSEKYIDFIIPTALPGFLGTSIALLLSFKLSQSYDRWWEARKIWGSIVNDSRSLVLQLLKFSDKKAIDIVKKIGLRQIAWCYSLAFTLRNQNNLSYLNKFISLKEVESLKHYKNLPLGILNQHNENFRKLYKEKYITDFQHIQLDDTIIRLCDSMGKLERIKKTIFPKTYRIVLRFFIYLFLIILSISLTAMDSWIEIPLIVAISTPFFLLERISNNMQNPFENKPTDTPMLAICQTNEVNIKQLINDKNLPKEEEASGFYLI
ncbi:bestrophin family protein [Tenacibaculum salmonis]|uniref:bestrophin family protein n=1 Tax=Tenacibaculum sp. P3-BQ1 TaxID=3232310 RepID=UPI0034DE973C